MTNDRFKTNLLQDPSVCQISTKYVHNIFQTDAVENKCLDYFVIGHPLKVFK